MPCQVPAFTGSGGARTTSATTPKLGGGVGVWGRGGVVRNVGAPFIVSRRATVMVASPRGSFLDRGNLN